MHKKRLALPEGFKFNRIELFFAPKKSDTPAEQESNPTHSSLVEERAVDSEEADSQKELLEELAREDNLPRPSLKRIIRGTDREEISQTSSPPLSDTDTSSSKEVLAEAEVLPDSQESIYSQMEAKNELQMENEGWLEKVTKRLRNYSQPVGPFADLRQEFLALKKQWGFTLRYESTEPNTTDCGLCDHQHVASLFEIKNIQNGHTLETGSHCITQFQVIDENTNTLLEKENSFDIIQTAVDEAQTSRQQYLNEVRQFFK
jgi:hypothetical protein